jgi:hypothetical protein
VLVYMLDKSTVPHGGCGGGGGGGDDDEEEDLM